MKLELNSTQLRGLVRDAVPITFRIWDSEPFTESSHDDGCLHYFADGKHDSFPICVPLREFLSARFGIPVDSVHLEWSSYEWRYRAELDGVNITTAELQRLDEYDC